MDGLHVFLVVFLGFVSSSHDQISGSVLEVTVRPGDNITLYCDCKRSVGVYIVWYRNCSHENQPSLVLSLYDARRENKDNLALLNLPRFHFVNNNSSESYDLLIMNVTGSDEGLYYCGTEQPKVVDENTITSRKIYTYGKITTRLLLSKYSGFSFYQETSGCGVCCTLLFFLCPACSVLSSLLSSLLVYHLYKKTAKEPQAEEKRHNTRGQTRLNQDEDVCYAALEIRQASQRPKKKKKIQSSDYSTYSAINTSRV
ncbi:hypothetical protein PAMP_021004 [Pampus punctatissimus]